MSEPRRSTRARAREEAQPAPAVPAKETPGKSSKSQSQQPQAQPPSQAALKRKRSSVPAKDARTTPAIDVEAETAPAQQPPKQVLPIRVADGQPLPTLSEPQPLDLPAREYQDIQHSGVLSASLQRSRTVWVSGVNFRLFHAHFVPPKKVADRSDEDKANMQRQKEIGRNFPLVGEAQLVIEPHTFTIRLYGPREVIKPAPKKTTTTYGQWGNHNQPGTYQYNHVQPAYQQPPPPPRPPQPKPPPPPKAPQPVPVAAQAPAPDPVIHMLAQRAGHDAELKSVMKIVAAGQATKEQLEFFQGHINELTNILQKQKDAAAKASPRAPAPPPSSSQPPKPPGQIPRPPSQTPQTPSNIPRPPSQASQSTPQTTQPPQSQTPQTLQNPSHPPPQVAQPTPKSVQPSPQGVHTIPQAAPSPSQAPPRPPQTPQAPPQLSPQPAPPGPSHASPQVPPQVSVQVHPQPPSHVQPAAAPPRPTATNPPPPHVPSPAPHPTNVPPPLPPGAGMQPPPKRPSLASNPYNPASSQPYQAPMPPAPSPHVPYSNPYSNHPNNQVPRQPYPPPQQQPHMPRYMPAPHVERPTTYRPLVFDFKEGNGDKFYFPTYSFMEWLPGTQGAKFSFLITKMKPKPEPQQKPEAVVNAPSTPAPKVEPPATPSMTPTTTPAMTPAMTPNPLPPPNGIQTPGQAPLVPTPKSTAKPVAPYVPPPRIEDYDERKDMKEIEFHQPVTFLILTANHEVLQSLPRAVRPPDMVEKYMNDVFDTTRRAEETYLAFRLPKEGAADADDRIKSSDATPAPDAIMVSTAGPSERKKPRRSLAA
ncbi:unnamed protein product [Periconia digitata]|uniref:SWR1-complex protein 3 domain-containing protein n=1 Tax=Periconia digitata TaxID=1303443 RepID=A0A9W4XWB6_9PLEO|nr:unnamed protein product [Periconia digitata]